MHPYEFSEALIELRRQLDRLGHNNGNKSPVWQKADVVMDTIMDSHFSTEESDAMRAADLLLDGGAK